MLKWWQCKKGLEGTEGAVPVLLQVHGRPACEVWFDCQQCEKLSSVWPGESQGTSIHESLQSAGPTSSSIPQNTFLSIISHKDFLEVLTERWHTDKRKSISTVQHTWAVSQGVPGCHFRVTDLHWNTPPGTTASTKATTLGYLHAKYQGWSLRDINSIFTLYLQWHGLAHGSCLYCSLNRIPRKPF